MTVITDAAEDSEFIIPPPPSPPPPIGNQQLELGALVSLMLQVLVFTSNAQFHHALKLSKRGPGSVA